MCGWKRRSWISLTTSCHLNLRLCPQGFVLKLHHGEPNDTFQVIHPHIRLLNLDTGLWTWTPYPLFTIDCVLSVSVWSIVPSTCNGDQIYDWGGSSGLWRLIQEAPSCFHWRRHQKLLYVWESVQFWHTAEQNFPLGLIKLFESN